MVQAKYAMIISMIIFANSGPSVNFVGDGIELLLSVPGQVGPFWQILADQAVHVFIGASLPWAVRVAKVHGNAGLRGQCLVQGHLPALVVGHAQPHRLGNAVELVGEGLEHVGGAGRLRVRQLDEHHQAAGALDQCADRTGVARAF